MPESGVGSPQPDTPASRLKVLVADDNPTDRMILSRLVSQLGHRVVVAENGQQAVDFFQSESPHLILLDALMPVMDGLTALRALRAREAEGLFRTPVLMVTAHAMTGDKERFLAAGADGYVSKPMSQASLQKEILRVLKH